MASTSDLEKASPPASGTLHTRNDHDVSYTSVTTPIRGPSREEEEITRMPTHISQASRTKKSIIGLAKTITARSNASVIDPGPPPDGGRKAWTQAVMAHFVVFNTWGMVATFGVFQQHYTLDLGLEPSAVSWIGSFQMLGHFSLGMLTGRLFDAGYFYWSVVPGMVIAALGMFMTSLCTKYWQFFLAQGLMTGLGNGMQFAPTLGLVSTYFKKNRTVALAVMASGSATGGLVYENPMYELHVRHTLTSYTNLLGTLQSLDNFSLRSASHGL
jgi:hypothetical protein